MSAIHTLNPKAEHVRRGQALEINISAAEGIMQIMRTNFGPSGTLKMLVSGAGDIKITKDGAVLLDELPIQNPTVALIARTAASQDDICGDGTTASILLIGELLRQARRWLAEDVHPRVIADGFELARDRVIDFLQGYRLEVPTAEEAAASEKAAARRASVFASIAYSALCTKIHSKLARSLAPMAVDAVTIVARAAPSPALLDLAMVEILLMPSKSEMDTALIRGIVMDHGSRHAELSCSSLENCFILTLNVSLEYEKSEVNSGYFYKNAEEHAQQAAREREFVTKKCMRIVELKQRVCTRGENFVVLNQKGVDPMSLDLLAEHGIFALRRVKRRNMERVTLCCGGAALHDLEALAPESLGWAARVHEELLGDEKYTFVDGVRDPKSCTFLIRGPSKHVLYQVKEALRDGLRAVRNILTDRFYLPGAGAFEVAAGLDLERYRETLSGKVRLGVQAFADAIMSIPKTLAKNAGYDPQESFLKIQEAIRRDGGERYGFNIATGEPVAIRDDGVLDNYRVKHQLIHSATVISCQLLLVDEILKAGRAVRTETDGMAEGMQDAE